MGLLLVAPIFLCFLAGKIAGSPTMMPSEQSSSVQALGTIMTNR